MKWDKQKSLVCLLNTVEHTAYVRKGYSINITSDTHKWKFGFITGSVSGECWFNKGIATLAICGCEMQHVYTTKSKITTATGFKRIIGSLILHHQRRMEGWHKDGEVKA